MVTCAEMHAALRNLAGSSLTEEDVLAIIRVRRVPHFAARARTHAAMRFASDVGARYGWVGVTQEADVNGSGCIELDEFEGLCARHLEDTSVTSF